jgi:perosamine synthetase
LRTIPIAGPSITELEVRYASDAAANGWYDRAGEYPRRFEQAFADLVQRRFAMCLPSCTSALHLTLAALDVGPDDEVILPDATWIATAAPVTYVGATPVFCDVDPITWCLSAGSAAARITPRTKAIVAVDLYGSMPDMAALAALAEEHGIALIEDAAEAVGSRIGNRPAGSFGTASAFSFHGSKTLTTGEGGMLVTDDEALFARADFLRDHGRTPGDVSFQNTEVAFKYKMSAVQAALGLAQTERIEELVTKKRQIFGWYADRLAGLPGLALNAEPPGTTNSYWMSTVLLPRDLGFDKIGMMDRLKKRGIATRPFFSPLSAIPAFAQAADRERAQAKNSVSYDICPRGLNLPSALSLTEADVDRVCAALKEELALAG